MGTRADFYVGRGPQAEWLGSIAWDGDPDGEPESVLAATTEADYRKRVEAVFVDCNDHATRPAYGWPWPWNDSRTTDYAYAFDDGKVWASCFGHAWYDPTDPPRGIDDGPKVAAFPDMKERQRVTFGERSGLIILSVPKEKAK